LSGDVVPLTLEARLERAEKILMRVAEGDLELRIETEAFGNDAITNLEMGINFLIMDLRSTAETNREQHAALASKQQELEAQLATIAQQALAITELSTPVLEVWSNVLALPLIGVLDTKRSAEVMANLLAKVSASQARCVIIDVTGIAVVDTGTADHLIKIAHAVELLGARCVLTGIAPAVARTLVAIGVSLGGVETFRSLKAGLEHCIDFLNDPELRS
jgi:rsbT co-antagonist protein RsbR